MVSGDGRGHEGPRTIGKVGEGEDEDCSGDEGFHVVVPVLVGTKQRRNNALSHNYSELGRSRPCGKYRRSEVRARQDAERAQEGQYFKEGGYPGKQTGYIGRNPHKNSRGCPGVRIFVALQQ